jgi:hypothetical protein
MHIVLHNVQNYAHRAAQVAAKPGPEFAPALFICVCTIVVQISRFLWPGLCPNTPWYPDGALAALARGLETYGGEATAGICAHVSHLRM